MTFPRERHGVIDDGRQVGTIGQRCSNCGSERYRQTVSTEDCPDCGLHCDYWGDGTNEVYRDMMARKAAEERERERQASLEDELV